MKLEPGKRIPDLTLHINTGESWSLSSQEGNKSLLFIPRLSDSEQSIFDTAFAQLRDNMKGWRSMQVAVVTICPGMTEKQTFQLYNRLNLNFNLLHDPEFTSVQAWGLEELFGPTEAKTNADWLVVLINDKYNVVHKETGKSKMALPDFNRILKRLLMNDL